MHSSEHNIVRLVMIHSFMRQTQMNTSLAQLTVLAKDYSFLVFVKLPYKTQMKI